METDVRSASRWNTLRALRVLRGYAVNRNCLSLFAASRTRCSPSNAFPQLCIWDAAACPVFSLVGRLPSRPSASEELPSLFGPFAGIRRPSDSLLAFMPRLWLITFLDRSVHSFVSDTGRASRFLRVEVPCMSGVFDLAGPAGARDIAPTSIAFPPNRQRRHPDFPSFRGSIPHLHVPLSTLHAQPHDWPRMARGRCGSPGLHRKALSSSPPRRFIPAFLFLPELLGHFRRGFVQQH
jgi:hypothetical protein